MIKFDRDNYCKFRDYRLSQPFPKHLDIHTVNGKFGILLNSLSLYERRVNRNAPKDEYEYLMKQSRDVLKLFGEPDAIEVYQLIYKGEK